MKFFVYWYIFAVNGRSSLKSVAGVNILQKEEDFVLGIFRVLQGRIPKKFDNLKKNK